MNTTRKLLSKNSATKKISTNSLSSRIIFTTLCLNVMKSELMESDSSLNFFHKNYFLFAKGIYYYAAQDIKKATMIANEMLKLWEANKDMNKVFFGAFYNTYYNKAL